MDENEGGRPANVIRGEAEQTALHAAASAHGYLDFVARSSVWHHRFSPDELRAAEVVLDALYRELERSR
jgi:hypothetical protein